jgi:hypothetical protein
LDWWLSIAPVKETPSPDKHALWNQSYGVPEDVIVDSFIRALAAFEEEEYIGRLWKGMIHKRNFVPAASNYITLITSLCDIGKFIAAYEASMQSLLLVRLGHDTFLQSELAQTIAALILRVGGTLNAASVHVEVAKGSLTPSQVAALRQDLYQNRLAIFQFASADELQRFDQQQHLIHISDARRIIYTLQNNLDGRQT